MASSCPVEPLGSYVVNDLEWIRLATIPNLEDLFLVYTSHFEGLPLRTDAFYNFTVVDNVKYADVYILKPSAIKATTRSVISDATTKEILVNSPSHVNTDLITLGQTRQYPVQHFDVGEPSTLVTQHSIYTKQDVIQNLGNRSATVVQDLDIVTSQESVVIGISSSDTEQKFITDLDVRRDPDTGFIYGINPSYGETITTTVEADTAILNIQEVKTVKSDLNLLSDPVSVNIEYAKFDHNETNIIPNITYQQTENINVPQIASSSSQSVVIADPISIYNITHFDRADVLAPISNSESFAPSNFWYILQPVLQYVNLYGDPQFPETISSCTDRGRRITTAALL